MFETYGYCTNPYTTAGYKAGPNSYLKYIPNTHNS